MDHMSADDTGIMENVHRAGLRNSYTSPDDYIAVSNDHSDTIVDPVHITAIISSRRVAFYSGWASVTGGYSARKHTRRQDMCSSVNTNVGSMKRL